MLLPLQNEDVITEIWLLSKDKFDRAADDRPYGFTINFISRIAIYPRLIFLGRSKPLPYDYRKSLSISTRSSRFLFAELPFRLHKEN